MKRSKTQIWHPRFILWAEGDFLAIVIIIIYFCIMSCI